MGVLEDIWATGKQVGTADFWRRIVSEPLAAPLADPVLAAKSAAVGAAATLAVAGGILVVPVVAKGVAALFGATKVAAPVVGFAARHPIVTFLAVMNPDLPTEVVRTVGAFADRPVVVAPQAPAVPAPIPVAPSPAPAPLPVVVRPRVVLPVTRPVAAPGFQAFFGQ